MDFYSYRNENQALKKQLKQLFEDRGDDLLEYYLNNGFDALAVGINLFEDELRKMLFDYLMIDRKALLECIRRNKNFFVKMIVEGDGERIRPMLGIDEEKYSALWREALDLMSLYFVEKKVIEKMTNFELEKFFNESIFGRDISNIKDENEG